jgi:release factor glutamine methyltransferase
MHSIKELLEFGRLELKDTSEIPNKESRILLAHLLDKDLMWLITHDEEKVTCKKAYQELLERLKSHEPIEYITNKASFYNEEFYVDARVLIPRPETEILVDKVLFTCKELETPSIVEIGCGSGIISIMLALLLPKAKIKAVDISLSALEVALINAKKFGLEDRIEFIQSDLLENIEEKSFDILVSNPPYIADNESLHVKLSYEPSNALFGGVVGDELLKKIIDLFLQRDIKILACEMGYDQKEKISEYLKEYNLQAEFYQDLAGLDRGFVLKKEQ